MRIKEEAFSGLEAAIIVIALVVVAAVFGMSVLSSGFYASDQAKTTTTGGYKLASSTLYIEGGVYATLNAGTHALDQVSFGAAIPETGQPQDLNKLLIVYTHSVDPSIVRQFTYGPTATSTTFSTDGTGAIMQPGEKRIFQIAQVNGPVPGGWFTIDLKPENGASTFVTYHLTDSFQGGSILT